MPPRRGSQGPVPVGKDRRSPIDALTPDRPAVIKPVVGRGGIRRRIRRLVPRPIRRTDLALFRSVATTELPIVGPALPTLSRAANHSRLWMAIAAVLPLVGGRAGRRAALRGVLAIAITSTLTNLPAKLLTGRGRPDLAIVPEIRRLARVPESTSFPSGHSASAFAFATAVGLEQRRLRIPLTGLATAVAFSRVYTGVHYPGDVLVGAAIGAGIAGATTRSWPLMDPTPARADVADRIDQPVGQDGDGLIVVANVHAGNALAPAPADHLRALLPAARIMEAEPGEDLPKVLRRAASEARALGVAGGDGSANAAAAVASEFGVPLLVVPTGTLNHLATDLGIDSIAAAARAVRQGRTIAMDLGEVDGHPFVNAASVGVYPHLVADRERVEDRVGKWPATLWGLARIMATREPFDIELDGRSRRVWMLFVGNNRFTATGLAPTRRARLDDGELDVRLIHAERSWARTRVLGSLLIGRLQHSSVYERRTTHELHISSLQGPLQLARDGETWQGPTEVTVRKRQRALQVLQP